MAKIVFSDRYTWKGYPSNWFESKEPYVQKGDVRIIEGTQFYAHKVKLSRWCLYRVVSWIPTGPVCYDPKVMDDFFIAAVRNG